jgi:hypothetical protein
MDVGPKHVRLRSTAEPSQSGGQTKRAAENSQDRGLARLTDRDSLRAVFGLLLYNRTYR